MEATQIIDPKKFKIHASQAGKIMAGDIGLTEAQAKTLWELENKPKARTEIQEATMSALQRKRDNPELPLGAKSYCHTWMKEILYGRKKEFTSKYTARGDMSELEALDRIKAYLKLDSCEKNDEFFENEWCCGTPDVKEPLFDAKCPWTCWTFPLFEKAIPEPDYFYQLQVYMDLLKTPQEAKLAYALVNTPEPLVVAEASSWCKKNGEVFRPEIVDEFREYLSYDHLPENLKIKIYTVKRDNAVIEEIHRRVVMCRAYIQTMLDDPQLYEAEKELYGEAQIEGMLGGQ